MPTTYAELLRVPGIRAPLVSSVIGRLPIGASTLATILLVQSSTGSFVSAGIVEACLAIGLAVGLPQLGRLVDRGGQTRVLVVAVTVQAAALVGLVVAARADASVPVMGALAMTAGASTPPLGLCMRGLWSSAIEDDVQLQSAFAIEAVVVEVSFICGPLLAGGLTAAASASVAVLAAAGLSLFGTLAFASSDASRSWRGPPQAGGRHWAGPLGSGAFRVIALCSGLFGLGQGALELTLTAFGAGHGSSAIAGPLIAIQAGASLVAGIWYGARRWRGSPVERFVLLNLLLALGFAPLALAGSVGVLAVLMVLPGLALAPVTSTCYLLIDRIAPAGTSTEAFGWSVTAAVAGSGLGSALAGGLVNGGHVEAGFLAAFGAVAMAAVAAAVGRGSLAGAAEPVPSTL